MAIQHVPAVAPLLILGSTIGKDLVIIGAGMALRAIGGPAFKSFKESWARSAKSPFGAAGATIDGTVVDGAVILEEPVVEKRLKLSLTFTQSIPRPPLRTLTESSLPSGKRIIEGIATFGFFKGYAAAIIETPTAVVVAPMEEDEAYDHGEDAMRASEQMRRIEFGTA